MAIWVCPSEDVGCMWDVCGMLPVVRLSSVLCRFFFSFCDDMYSKLDNSDAV